MLFRSGMSADAKIDAVRRMDIMRNHTAAHLLQAALREVLGNHVEQAGQLVTDHSVRFDFTHFSAPTAQELMAVEERVNEVILAGMPVEVMEMPIDEAKKMGAMALFGEKYGDVVRVVKAGDFSTELCGGTHVDNTAKIGLFKIRQEGSVAAGVRRIEAVTGHGVLKMVEDAMNMIAQTAITLKISNPREIVAGAERVAGELKEQSRKIQELSDKIAATQIDSLMANSQLEKGVRIICAAMTDVTGDMIKEMCGKILDVAPKAVIVLAGINEGKVTFGCACGKEAREKGANAGKIVKAVAQIAGGNGGGKPDLAMAGAKDPTKVDEAIMQAKAIILDMIKE